jgi:hypothetical protein
VWGLFLALWRCLGKKGLFYYLDESTACSMGQSYSAVGLQWLLGTIFYLPCIEHYDLITKWFCWKA